MSDRIRSVHIANFHGMDASRNPAENREYGVGLRAINIGREFRSPLQARTGLRPVTTSNSAAEISGPPLAMGVMVHGERIHVLSRTPGGKLIVSKDVKPKDYVE